MTAIAAERSHLMRWTASAVVVVGLHALGAAALLAWHDPVGVGGDSPLVVDLALYAPPSDSPEDLPRGPIQQQAATPAPPEKVQPKPEQPEEKAETKIEPEPEEKIEVPPAPVPPVAALAPPPEAVEPPPPPEPTVQPAPPTDTPPAPATTAPAREHHASAEEIDAWKTGIATLIESNMIFPEAARARRQKGTVKVAFSFNRQGRVVSSQVANTSGYTLLDRAALETLQRAQPLPPPPVGTPGDVFTFIIPLRFRLQLQ
jgi:protein TonB